MPSSAGAPLQLSDSEPSDATLTRSVAPVERSYTNTSDIPFVSPATKFEASELNATNRPSSLKTGCPLWLSASVPSDATLTRSVAPVERSYTNTSDIPFVSPATKFEASELNATNRPSSLKTGCPLWLSASVPSDATLTRSVAPVERSYTNTSDIPFVSPATKFEAHESKATNRPSSLRDPEVLRLSPSVPSELTLTRCN